MSTIPSCATTHGTTTTCATIVERYPCDWRGMSLSAGSPNRCKNVRYWLHELTTAPSGLNLPFCDHAKFWRLELGGKMVACAPFGEEGRHEFAALADLAQALVKSARTMKICCEANRYYQA